MPLLCEKLYMSAELSRYLNTKVKVNQAETKKNEASLFLFGFHIICHQECQVTGKSVFASTLIAFHESAAVSMWSMDI